MLYQLGTDGSVTEVGEPLEPGAHVAATLETDSLVTAVDRAAALYTIATDGSVLDASRQVPSGAVTLATISIPQAVLDTTGGELPSCYPATALLPAGVSFTRVRASFVQAVLDLGSCDPDDLPDGQWPEGRVTFAPNLANAPIIRASGKGVFIVPESVALKRGELDVWVVSSVDSDTNPPRWSYTVTVTLAGQRVLSAPFEFEPTPDADEHPENAVNLLDAIAVQATPGTWVTQGPRGEEGPPGPPGQDADGYGAWVHHQTDPQDTWTINHDLAYAPAGVTVIDGGGTVHVPETVQHSTGVTRLGFAEPVAGTAYLS